MNLIALMQPLSLIKHLKIHLQATCVFFCATSVQIYFLNTDLIWLIDLILLLVLLVFILLF